MSDDRLLFPALYMSTKAEDYTVHTHGLFAHSALVGVARWLIVMRIWDKTCTDTKQREWFNLKMCCLPEM